eukprot:scaffold30414_cov38-Tisochrysis_lutea.AAC.2
MFDRRKPRACLTLFIRYHLDILMSEESPAKHTVVPHNQYHHGVQSASLSLYSCMLPLLHLRAPWLSQAAHESFINGQRSGDNGESFLKGDTQGCCMRA